MAKRITNKKELIQKRNAIINNIKNAYEKVRKTNPELPGFYNTKAYKDLDKKRQRSFKRYDKRDEINEKRRENNNVKKIIPNKFDVVTDVSVYEAYNGKGRIFEDSLIQKHKANFLFEGAVKYKKSIRYFDNYSNFRIETNKIIAIIYAIVVKKGSDELFKWFVTRAYSVTDKAVLISYNFYRIKDESDTEENESE